MGRPFEEKSRKLLPVKPASLFWSTNEITSLPTQPEAPEMIISLDLLGVIF
jgi:hypothetical protein